MNGEIWYAIPTANLPQAARTLAAWRARGYRTAVLVDGGADIVTARALGDLMIWTAQYEGWPRAANALARTIFAQTAADIVVTGGDDVMPDGTHSAGDLGEQFRDRFGADGLGVMQPTGDRWMPDKTGVVAIERICGSPWIGRGLAARLNGGLGAFRPEYRHFFADEELKCVTERLGLLWQRPDVTQIHEHWSRRLPGRARRRRPDYLRPAQAHWAADRDLFHERQAAGFPGHELLG